MLQAEVLVVMGAAMTVLCLGCMVGGGLYVFGLWPSEGIYVISNKRKMMLERTAGSDQLWAITQPKKDY